MIVLLCPNCSTENKFYVNEILTNCRKCDYRFSGLFELNTLDDSQRNTEIDVEILKYKAGQTDELSSSVHDKDKVVPVSKSRSVAVALVIIVLRLLKFWIYASIFVAIFIAIFSFISNREWNNIAEITVVSGILIVSAFYLVVFVDNLAHWAMRKLLRSAASGDEKA